LSPSEEWAKLGHDEKKKDQPIIIPKNEKEQNEDKQVEWKNRLKQWKVVRQSNTIMKSE